MNNLEEHGRLYDSVPVPVPVDTELVDKVRDFMQATSGEWRTTQKIALAIGVKPKDTNVNIRKAIALLVERDGLAIINAGPRGFTLAKNARMVEKSIEREDKRLKGLRRRITALEIIAERMRDEEKMLRMEDRRNGWFPA